MWARVCTRGHPCIVRVYMWRLYVARNSRGQSGLAALSPANPFLRSTDFSCVLFLETQVKRKSNRDSPTGLLLIARQSCVGEGVFVRKVTHTQLCVTERVTEFVVVVF